MGCWGFGIMESDDAMDLECGLLEVAELDTDADDFDETSLKTRFALEARLPELLERAASEPAPDGFTYYRAMAHQVLATLLMQAGCAMSEETRQTLMTGIRDCNEYGFAKSLLREIGERRITAADLERHDVTTGFRGYDGHIERLYGRMAAIDGQLALLASYAIQGGALTETPSRGLFEAFDDALGNNVQ